ncbi:type II toxin-antitoxin system RelE family toxin [Actinotignum sanguinis]|uniref:Type II toxin-antitoxin system RelE/ParE family toxin n=2 Tax=Actinomycetaceae TaxID=2049 RepID=A0ABZ0RJR4_9ACTO|nr:MULTISPECIES: type II toxin-antitoxin system RelE/ParE family toxin [Actinotignum]WPJ89171.1 type II toxin-antitoxin system RelE/ParE family toxin [Schaalia turicensis]MDE1553570.1 type II toxin-antitoxin system RelE/ParE family toxin [Actinotignum sanguinis]MDE1564777.1 type II toxin-antitoxin system RelE/ParE family toxin [Actinotignum sanguinis]MDE1576812.1 type II toxin-antitoxin system RelE/ParE family toxin [Actinotignum sanguinis]MDE1642380.1 type II toxin-antitoxin system RelE/ParE 
MYRVILSNLAGRQLRKLEKPIRDRILGEIEKLAVQPRPVGVKKLTNYPAWRIRVGNYRVIYEIEDDKLLVTVLRAAHRREVYA